VPDIGSDDEVDVIDVLVSAGDTIEKEDGLITLETDKATMDVPSTHAGTAQARLQVNRLLAMLLLKHLHRLRRKAKSKSQRQRRLQTAKPLK